MVRASYTYANNADQVLRLLKKLPQYASVLEKAGQTAEYFRNRFADDPGRCSGWGHNFVCPDCASHMVFDLEMEYSSGNAFRCPHCGRSASGQDYDEAWVYYYRYEFAQMTESAALCTLLGDEKSLKALCDYVDFYAEHYADFPVHGRHAGYGKVMDQGLDEAVWAIRLIRSLAVCGEKIPREKKTVWFEKLFRPLAELLIPQADKIHNIPTWLLCAVGMIGIYFENDPLLEHAVNSDYGLRRQVEEGFTADGIWHEGSMTYHYYTVEALSYFCGLYALRSPEDPLFRRFAQMHLAPLILSSDGIHVPALNDGWYPCEIPMHILLAARICPEEKLTEQLRRIQTASPELFMTPAFLLYGMPEEDVVLLRDSGLAVFRKPFHMILKSGVIAASHRHRDYLSVVLSPFSDDLGTPGYGHPLTPAWYRLPPSHNTVCVDGTQPSAVIPSRVEEIEDGVRAVIQPGVWEDLQTAQRTLIAENGGITDRTELIAESEHIYDWFFHGTGEVFCTAQTAESEESVQLGEKTGYQYLENVRRVSDADEPFTIRFTLETGESLTLTVENRDGQQIYLAQSPGNPADCKRTAVLLRQRGKTAEFTVHFACGKSNKK